MAHKENQAVVQWLEDKANEIRLLSIDCTNASKSGKSCFMEGRAEGVLVKIT